MQLNGHLGGELWKTPQLTLPPRSRLYCLEPIGLGTGWVESLSGYVSRLAEAHVVSTGILFGHEIALLVDKPYLKKERFKSLAFVLWHLGRDFTTALNGVGTNVPEWIKALESATLRRDLSGLTMSAWRRVLTNASLLRPKRAWCPACYEEQRAGGQVVYDPLMWFLQPVNICLVHRRRLRTVCGFCNRQFNILSNKSRPGFCSICGGWLGVAQEAGLTADDILTDAEFNWEEWVITNLAEIIAAVPKLRHKPSPDSVATSIELCLRPVSGNVTALSRIAGAGEATLRKWYKRGDRVQLDLLLRFCFQIKVPPLEFLTGSISTKTIQNWSISAAGPKIKMRAPRRRVRVDLQKLELLLRGALEEDPPPSLWKVIQPTRIQHAAVYKYFPDLGRAIRGRYVAYHVERRRAAGAALEEAVKDGAHSSREDVARKLGRPVEVLSRTFPDLCRILSERRGEAQKERWLDVQRELEKLLAEWPPLSRGEVAKRTGYSRHTIRKRFPDLYRRLIDRYMDYYKAKHTATVIT